MKRIYSVILAAVLLLGLCACGQKADVIAPADAPTWQEQYDLGIRYLSEGNYEEAIIAFTAAIEIDPKRADAYLKAAEAYEAMGDTEGAAAMLEQGVSATQDAALQERLDALRKFANVPAVPEILTAQYNGVTYIDFLPEYYVTLPEEAAQVFADIIAAGQAGDQDYLRSNITSDLLRETAKAYCSQDGFSERENYAGIHMWTKVDDALLCYHHQIHENDIWIELDYRPKNGIAFSCTYDAYFDGGSFEYAVGSTKEYLFNGPFSKYRISEVSEQYNKVTHTGTAVNELIHGEYISEYHGTYDNYTEYKTYENGYVLSCWQDDDGKLVTSKNVYPDGSVRYLDFRDEYKKELQPVLRTW